MLLNYCPECGYEGMSDKAEHCPKCGAPYWPMRRVIIMLAYSLVVAAASRAIYLYAQYKLAAIAI